MSPRPQRPFSGGRRIILVALIHLQTKICLVSHLKKARDNKDEPYVAEKKLKKRWMLRRKAVEITPAAFILRSLPSLVKVVDPKEGNGRSTRLTNRYQVDKAAG